MPLPDVDESNEAFQTGEQLAYALYEAEGEVERLEGLVVASFSPGLRTEAEGILGELRLALAEMFMGTLAFTMVRAALEEQQAPPTMNLCPACKLASDLRFQRLGDKLLAAAEDATKIKRVAAGMSTLHDAIEVARAKREEAH